MYKSYTMLLFMSVHAGGVARGCPRPIHTHNTDGGIDPIPEVMDHVVLAEANQGRADPDLMYQRVRDQDSQPST